MVWYLQGWDPNSEPLHHYLIAVFHPFIPVFPGMLRMKVVPTNLTTELRELNHSDFFLRRTKKGNPCFHCELHSTPFWLTLITHIFFSEWPDSKATQAELSEHYISTASQTSPSSPCISIFHLFLIMWYCITVSGFLKINKPLSHLDVQQSNICIACESLLKNNRAWSWMSQSRWEVVNQLCMGGTVERSI